jgi:hypothetical protein
VQKNKIVKLMVLTNSFAWDDLPSTDIDGETTTISARLPVIKKFVKIMSISTASFNGIYGIIRVASSGERMPPSNSYYIFDISPSPVYELIFLTQVHSMVHLIFYEKAFARVNIMIKLTGHKLNEDIIHENIVISFDRLILPVQDFYCY